MQSTPSSPSSPSLESQVASWQKWTIFASMCLGIFILAFATTAVTNTMIPIRNQMHMNSSQLQWTINAYILAAASFIIISGPLGDRYGRRNMFVIGALFFMAGSVLAAVSTTPTLFIVARLLQGVGAAIIMPGTLAMMKVTFGPTESHIITVGWACGAGLGFGLGPAISGVLVATIGWPILFWLTFSIISISLILLLVAQHQHININDNVTVDYWGLGCYLIGFVPFVFAFVEGNSLGWGNAWIISLLVFGAFFMSLQGWVERRVKQTPFVDFNYFKRPRFLLGCMGMFVVGFILIGTYYFGNIFLQNPMMLNYSAFKSGFAIMPVGVALFIAALVTDKLIALWGNRPVNHLAMLCMICGTVWFLCLDLNGTYNLLWEPFLLLGFGGGIGMKAFPAIAMDALSVEEASRASSLVNANLYIGAIFATAIGTILMLNLGRREFLLLTQKITMPNVDKIALNKALMGHPQSIHSIINKFVPNHAHQVYHAFQSASLKGFHYAMISLVVVAALGMFSSYILKKKPVPRAT